MPDIWKVAFVPPITKTGHLSNPNNYGPTSKPCLANVLRGTTWHSKQFAVFVQKKHSTITVTTEVLNDIINATDSKEYCGAL